MNKHTPGPWEVLNQTDIFTGLGADSGDGVKANSTDGWMIADCGGCITFTEIGEIELGHELRKANAKLIAAAPDLLEALQDLTDDITERFDMDSPSTNPGIKHCIGAARAAIAKATQ